MWEKAFQKVEMTEEMVEGDAGWYKGRDWKHQLEKGGVRCAVRLEMDGDPT